MPVRRRLQTVQERAVNPRVFRWGDGTWCFFEPYDPVYPNRAEAERAWRRCRRAVWASTYRFSVPAAARVYDGITNDAADLVRNSWDRDVYPLGEALSAIERERATLAAFASREPRAAKAIADFLEMRIADLDLIEATVRDLAARVCDTPGIVGIPST